MMDFHYLYKETPYRIQSSILHTRGGHLANGLLHKRNAQSKYSSTQEESLKQMKIKTLGDHKDHKLENS